MGEIWFNCFLIKGGFKVGSNMVVGRVWFLWYGLIFDDKAKLFYYGVVWTVGGN
jgi:hypothetical protein